MACQEKLNIVKKHVDFFADGKGNLTDEVMKSRHIYQNIEKGVDLKIRAIKICLVNETYLKQKKLFVPLKIQLEHEFGIPMVLLMKMSMKLLIMP